MGETFAVDTKDFWAKVGALNFPALFKNSKSHKRLSCSRNRTRDTLSNLLSCLSELSLSKCLLVISVLNIPIGTSFPSANFLLPCPG